MKEELQQKLFKKYPKIFSQVGKSPEESNMAFGIQTGDGWHWLIDQVCGEIQRLTDMGHPQIVAEQIKEKFGVLRFYVQFPGASDRQFDILLFAERLSATICERCGSTSNVELRKIDNILTTLCDKCFVKNSTDETL